VWEKGTGNWADDGNNVTRFPFGTTVTPRGVHGDLSEHSRNGFRGKTKRVKGVSEGQKKIRRKGIWAGAKWPDGRSLVPAATGKKGLNPGSVSANGGGFQSSY